MIFDTWGGLLEGERFLEFSLRYTARVLRELAREHAGVRVPSIVYARGCARWLEAIAQSGCDAVGVDCTVDLGEARARVGGRVALQGNLDPAVLLAAPEAIRAAAAAILSAYGRASGHVFNLGQGVLRETPPEHVGVLVEAVHELSRAYH
jgi:uroporphyrinogen decarboxylase